MGCYRDQVKLTLDYRHKKRKATNQKQKTKLNQNSTKLTIQKRKFKLHVNTNDGDNQVECYLSKPDHNEKCANDDEWNTIVKKATKKRQ